MQPKERSITQKRKQHQQISQMWEQLVAQSIAHYNCLYQIKTLRTNFVINKRNCPRLGNVLIYCLPGGWMSGSIPLMSLCYIQ